RLNAICEQAPVVLHPRDAVIRDLKLTLLLEVNPGEHHGSRSKQNQQASGKAELKIPVHGPQRRSRSRQNTAARRVEHFRCHALGHEGTSKCRWTLDCDDSRSSYWPTLSFLGGF